MKKTDLFRRALQRVGIAAANWQNDRRILALARQVVENAPASENKPVVFFNASARLTGLSLNAAFSLLTAWAVQLVGAPVVHFVCQSGMSRCVLGTNPDDYSRPMPCEVCLRQSRVNYTAADVRYFSYQRDEALAAALAGLSLDQLMTFTYPTEHCSLNNDHWSLVTSHSIPLGALVLPGIRWALRRHNLPDDESTRFLYREYILSDWNVARGFTALLDEVRPETAVIFNGQFFPEATARWLAQKRGVRVITYEVGMQPFSAFFTDGEATAYPIHIPGDFKLSDSQNAQLDAYLEKRFQGKFTMAGIRFWPEMRGLDEAFLQKASGFRQIVPVFTNVIFDTSQPHSNVVFADMFAWLDMILEIICAHPETLFVIRAHPDEKRPGTRKQSRETVQAWVQRSGSARLPNVVFLDSQEHVSSYELIQRAKFVMVYNSSIGLEASIMGTTVLCGGKARFTQYPTVFFPSTPQAYRQQAEEFLVVDKIEVPPEFQRYARRFLYYQLFRTSLSFEKFLKPYHRPGMVTLARVDWEDLLPERSLVIDIILAGLLKGKPFLLEPEQDLRVHV